MALINSTDALCRAIAIEIEKKPESSLHGILRITKGFAISSNGLRHCRVQLECGAGCGYLVEAYGDEADLLDRIATSCKCILDDIIQSGTSESTVQAEEAQYKVLHKLHNGEALSGQLA